MRIAAVIAAAILMAPLPAVAQQVDVEEVIVTGSRMMDWDPDDIPVVQIERRADNLIVSVRVVNDTRDAATRRAASASSSGTSTKVNRS